MVAITFYPDSINHVLGDASYFAACSEGSPEEIDEISRIQLHLAYVERKLLSADITHLGPFQRTARADVIQKLRAYRLAGIFPQHHLRNVPWKRRPYFIDQYGVHCAVGHLMAVTGYSDLAERINAEHAYDYIADIHTPGVAEWAERHGLTLDECAMIQPAYECLTAPISHETTSLLIAGAYFALHYVFYFFMKRNDVHPHPALAWVPGYLASVCLEYREILPNTLFKSVIYVTRILLISVFLAVFIIGFLSVIASIWGPPATTTLRALSTILTLLSIVFLLIVYFTYRSLKKRGIEIAYRQACIPSNLWRVCVQSQLSSSHYITYGVAAVYTLFIMLGITYWMVVIPHFIFPARSFHC